MLRPPGANFQLLFLRLAQAFGSRTRPDARLWLVSLQPRTACGLMKNLTARKSRLLLHAAQVGSTRS